MRDSKNKKSGPNDNPETLIIIDHIVPLNCRQVILEFSDTNVI